MTKAFHFKSSLFILGIVVAFIMIGSASVVWAQESSWSQPTLVFEGQGQVSHPNLVADQYGQVHAFWVFTSNSVGIVSHQLYYARLDQPSAQPIDIFLGGDNFSSLAAIGNNQQIFVLWDGNNMIQAGASPRLSAQAWSAPALMGSAYSQVGFARAADDSLWMAYGDNSTNAVFVRRLDPGTGVWGTPKFVSNTSNANSAPDAVHLTVSANGSIHVVWSEYQLPDGWPPLGVFYSHSDDGGQNWTASEEMAKYGYNQPSIVAGAGQNIYMTWVGIAGVGGKYFSESSDEGRTWSGTTNLLANIPGGGSEGAPSMVVDTSGVLHVVFSANNCVWYMQLSVAGWTDPACISNGIPTSHTEEPVMTLGLGNRLHVLWWTNDRQLWYLTRQLLAPGLPTVPTPTPIIPTAVPPTAIPTRAPTPTHLPDYGPPMDASLPAQTGTWAVIAGIAPVVLLVLIISLRRLFR